MNRNLGGDRPAAAGGADELGLGIYPRGVGLCRVLAEDGIRPSRSDGQVLDRIIVVILHLDRLQAGPTFFAVPFQRDLLLVGAGIGDDLQAGNFLRLLDRRDRAVGLDVEAKLIPCDRSKSISPCALP